MKSRELLTPILSSVVSLCVVLIIWNPVVNFTFIIAQGQDPSFDLGDDYEMCGPGRTIIRWRSRDNFEWDGIIHPEATLEFALKGPWIIGRTEKGWFAIQKKSHEVHYPVPKDQLETVTGLDTSSLDMETDPWPYLIARPEALAAKAKANRLCWVMVFVVPLLLGFGPYACMRIAKSARK
ncbi:MAG TPA: hypothetical protein VMX13_06625 [Sedimentisphaerales bacterium]|nr:hypothetical protein [Sedimentisphaerales bacterium]